MYDVFLFLGTSKMNLKYIRDTKARYEAFSNLKIKYVVLVYYMLINYYFFTLIYLNIHLSIA